ncbi:MAG: XisI protein [Desulfobacterales bacterium]|nr:XisI protein [Desulfobacterales bacterium]
MARINEYRDYIQNILNKYSSYKSSYDDSEIQLIEDKERDHYQLVSVGWHGQQRIYGCILHIDLKGDKIWIQHDGTEIGIANELLSLGVPKKDIVLGFHAPYKRKYTEFAVN